MRRPSGRRSSARQSRAGRSTASRPATQRRRPPATKLREPGQGKAARPASSGGRPGGRLTGRAAVLGLALCVVVLTLAYPMREYLAQRSQIAQLTEQEQAQRDRVADLEEQRKRWEDPAYVRAQAKQRLQYVMPGEVGYVVIDPGAVAAASPDRRSATVLPPDAAKNSPWYSQLWGTVPVADSAK